MSQENFQWDVFFSSKCMGEENFPGLFGTKEYKTQE